MSLDKLETYINRNGFPIMRRCLNCVHWQNGIAVGAEDCGYCKASPLHFAFTLNATVFPITKDFYLCEKHEFINEEVLKAVCEKVMLKDSIKKKDDVV